MAISLIRTVIIYVVMLIGVRLMGKRQIGELQPFELVVTILISDLAAVPMQDVSLPLTSGLIPLATIIALEVILSGITMKTLKFRRFITGNPTVLIKNGKVIQKEMHRVNFTVDDLMESLRLCGYSDPSDLDFAVLETNGQLSVFPTQSQGQPASGNNNAPQQGGAQPPQFYIPIVSDGEILQQNLTFFGKDQNWLQKQLKSQKLQLPQVFLMTVNAQGQIKTIVKERANEKV